MMNEALLTPFDSYNNFYKKQHEENVSMFFEGLVDATGVDREANKKTISEINAKKDEIEELNKQKGGKKFLKFLLIFGMIILPILTIIFWYLFFNNSAKLYLPLVFTFVTIIAYVLFIHLIRRINNQIKVLNAKKAKLNEEINKLTKLSWEQMAKLNRSYDWSMAADLMKKTIPLLELDDNFNPKRFELLNAKFGFKENTDVNKSTRFVQSGSILGNPFVISTATKQIWGTKTYRGELTIRWTETYRDSEGHIRTRSRVETLVAYLEKPIPVYYDETQLIFGNEAAPKLSFSRNKSGVQDMNERQIESMIKKESKQFDKMTRKAVMNKSSYTRIGNEEFESLFGGEDRDNEAEFRLLFTPLAQTNLIKLIRSKEPFGDDFVMLKRKKINVIRSDHSQVFNYLCNPSYFISNSYLDAKSKFETYCNDYFKSLYFDFAPLLSIPIYQQYKTRDYIYKNDYPSNITSFEHEAMANSFDNRIFVAPDSRTQPILKVNFNGKSGKTDSVDVTAHTFTCIKHVSYVSKLGGDGRTHNVPVEWEEYIPASKVTKMAIKEERTTQSEFISHTSDSDFKGFLNSLSLGGRFSYQRGLLAVLLRDDVSSSEVGKLNSCLTSIEKPLDDSLSRFDDSELKKKMLDDDVIEKAIEKIEDIDKSIK